MIRKITTESPRFDHSTKIARINALSPGHRSQNEGQKNLSNSAPNSVANTTKPKKEARTFYPSKPFFYCGELSHWVPTCQIKQKPLKIWAQTTPSNASVAGFDAGPLLESLEALLNSGATHSVVGDISLFTHMTTTNMSLSVSSNQKLPVVGIGQIRLRIGDGFLTINNVLYCKEIPGIILSISQMLGQLIKVFFHNNKFIISQENSSFHSFRRGDRWFLEVKKRVSYN
ncbi:hypothetical protein O181_007798 [Austropuccinia psidii MF-1]|uniref:Retrovirus-related Pol polyprotein from transposon TNT 1-94-like beta-barrel domain-containing protein n=1 Tax=Austropuccinia psidii MF-1 TaxID=1389203 RepID=A0A9Q3GHY4_9BASI|nr:hypothetical protein [Austropuccinia psidii MF-1]